MTAPLKVMKFGGTSVGSAERLRRIVEIVRGASEEHRVVVIASAANGVTDALVGAWDQADTGALNADALCDRLLERHLTLAGEILQPEGVAAYRPVLENLLAELRGIVDRLVCKGKDPSCRDALIAMGERLSAPLVARAICEADLECQPFDATLLVRTDEAFGEANVDLDRTYRQVRRWFRRLPENVVPVVTGFIGCTKDGRVTTLGRGGSDYSAALLASALKASVLERWTDVDGIYTDDPRKNPNAKRYAAIVLEEAWAWNQAGKLGMHRKALDPLVVAGVPVHVRSTAEPDHPGTLILPGGHEQAQRVAVGQ